MTNLVLTSVRQPGDSTVSDLHIAGGFVSALGGRPAPAGARTIDCDGRYVIPGLWDEHVHMTQWALHSNRLDLSGADSARNAATTVAAFVADADPSVTSVGVGFRDALWSDVPTLKLLDDATRNQPTALISHDLHSVWLNSAAAQRHGVTVGVDGLLREEPAFALTRGLGRLQDSLVDGWVSDAANAAAAMGIVGIVDFEMTWNADPWRRRLASGFNTLRVDSGVYAEDLPRANDEGMRTGLVLDGSAGLLRVGPLKVLIDGSLNTRTAYCVDPYPEGGHGLLTVSYEELTSLLQRAQAFGFVPAVHAIGDAANKVALDAFEHSGVGGRIEHAQFVRTEDFARFGQLNVIASVQPVHALDDRDAADSNWRGRTDRAFPLRSLLDAGATLALGSDAPVAPLNPWAAMSAATARSRDDGRGPWHPGEGITRSQALAASARGRARIEAGNPADLVILDDDPLSVSDKKFAAMPVSATLLGGRFTFNNGLVATFDKACPTYLVG